MTEETLLSDDLLRQLMAVGQVDVLVGVPTLNNAATIESVVKTVHRSFARYFPKDRTVLINSDGGSTDGTPVLVRNASVDDADTLTVSHGLRTMHRISTPYHGVPGKSSALRQIMAAADLSQAKAVAVLDPDVTSVTPEWIAALINPVKVQQFDFVSPVYRRGPVDGPLVTQVLRPVIRAAYGWRISEPLAAEFGCSAAFAANVLEQGVWDTDLAKYGIDLWVTGHALSRGFRCCQVALGPHLQATKSARPGFQETFEQIVGALVGCLELHEPYWTARDASEPLPTLGAALGEPGPALPADGHGLIRAFCEDLANLRAVLEPILSPDTLAHLVSISSTDCEHVRYPDDLWATTVYEFLAAQHRGVMHREHVMRALAPLYLGRAGSFLVEHAGAQRESGEAALESLCLAFEQSKPSLVQHWHQTKPEVSDG